MNVARGRTRSPLKRVQGGRLSQDQALNLCARAIQAIGVGALLFVMVAALTETSRSTSSGSVIRGYLIANIAIYVYVVLHSRRGGVSLIVSFFFLFFISIPASVQIDSGAFPFNSTYLPEELARGFAIAALAQISYECGEFFADLRTRHPRRLREPTPLQVDTYWRAVAVIVVVSMIITMIVGPSRLFITREELASAFLEGDGLWQQLLFIGRALSLLAAVIAAYLLVHDRQSRTPRLYVLSSLAFTSLVVLNYPPGLPRFQLLGAVLAILAVSLNFFLRGWKLLFAAIAPLFLFYLFPAIKALGLGEPVDILNSFQRDVQDYLTRVDFDGFKQIVDTTIYLESAPYRYGENFFGVLFFWVPRSIWPGKPMPTGEMVSLNLGFPYNNVSSPLPAEALVSFGAAGVVVVLFLAGVLVATAESHASSPRVQGSLAQSHIFLALLMGYGVILLRGALNAVAPMFMAGFAALGIIVILNRRRFRTNTAPIDSERNRMSGSV